MPDPLTIPLPRPWTKGPYSLAPVANSHRIHGGPSGKILADVHPTASRVSLANGQLFAASPDLFEALAGLLSDEHRDDLELIRLASSGSPLVHRAEAADAIARIDQREQAGRAALAKALGTEEGK